MNSLLPLLVLLAATPRPPAEPPARPLAVFDGGSVSTLELAREERFLSKDERMFREAQGHSLARRQEDWLERAALRLIARRLAESAGLTVAGEAAEKAHAAGRSFLVERWARSCYGLGFDLPSEAEVAAELTPTLGTIPPRIKLAHIFVRAETADEVAAASQRLSAWKAEIHDLDGFHALARQQSASQSARRGGELGWLRQGWLAKEAEAVLYRLQPGAMSEPIALRGGVHLFWVEDRRPEEREALAPRVRRRLAELRSTALDGCRQRRLGQARAMPSVGGGPAAGEDELLFRLAVATHQADAGELARITDLANNVWIEQVVGERVEATLGSPDPAVLRQRYDDAPERYRRPRELALRRLSVAVPRSGDPLAFEQHLRAAVERLAAGEGSWEEVRAAAGSAASEEAQPLLPQLDAASFLGPYAFDIIQPLAAGDVSGPIQDAGQLVVVKIEDERPEAQLSFEEALPKLTESWRAERRRQLNASVTAELLARNHFQLTPAGEALLRESPDDAPSPFVTPPL